MKNLLMLTIIMALATVCVSAQNADKTVTFSDHMNQSLTVDQFLTVVKFTHREKGELKPQQHSYRICPCDKERPCIDSQDRTNGVTGILTVESPVKESPVKDTKLKQGQTLEIESKITTAYGTVMRRLVWKAGSSTVQIQTLTFSRTKICCMEELSMPRIFAPEHHGCSMPPPDGFSLSCPPPPNYFSKAPSSLSQHSSTSTLEFSLWPRNQP